MLNEIEMIEKMLKDHADVFADVVNGLVFEGRQVIAPDDLVSTKERSQLKLNGKIHEQECGVKKFWKSSRVRFQIAVLGLESHFASGEDMPFWGISYDASAYEEQLANNEPYAPYPVVTLLLYFGTSHWTEPRSVLESVKGKIDPRFMPYVSDYKINVFEIAWLSEDEISLFRSDFCIVANYFRQKRLNPKQYNLPKKTIKHVDEVHNFLSAVLDNKDFSVIANKLVSEQKEGRVTTCEIVESILAKGEAKGKLEFAISMIHDGILSLNDGASRLGISAQELSEAGRKIYPDFPVLS